jgi:hypothetical protein
MFNSIYLDSQLTEKTQNITLSFYRLALKVRKLFSDWSKVSKGTFSFQFIDYLKIPFVKECYERSLRKDKTADQLIEDFTISFQKIEEFVQVLFLLILEDCLPDELKKIQSPFWINPLAVSLDADRWQIEGLFSPKCAPRDCSVINSQLRSLYTFHGQRNEPVPVAVSSCDDESGIPENFHFKSY